MRLRRYGDTPIIRSVSTGTPSSLAADVTDPAVLLDHAWELEPWLLWTERTAALDRLAEVLDRTDAPHPKGGVEGVILLHLLYRYGGRLRITAPPAGQVLNAGKPLR
jgi:hypothetical protein